MDDLMDMERKKGDELALVKAAAWAWYQHNSGSDGKPMREFDITRRRSLPSSVSYRPSRYKLEAMAMGYNNINMSKKSPTPTKTHDYASLLLDSYEIESISKRLNHLIDQFSGSKVHGDYHSKNNYHLSSDIGNRHCSSSSKKKKSNSHFLKGFLQGHAVLCGRNQDVDDSSPILRRPRRPEN